MRSGSPPQGPTILSVIAGLMLLPLTLSVPRDISGESRELPDLLPPATTHEVQVDGALAALPSLPPRLWLGPEGEPLPFRYHDEILDFLREAEVIELKDIPVGVTRPRKALLERNGVRAHAVFRDVDIELQAKRVGGRFFNMFRDSAMAEVAGYRLARLLGMDNVPPVVGRRIGRTDGSLQIWLEGVMTEGQRRERELKPADAQAWFLQTRMMRAFDSLIWNDDRNLGNILIDAEGKIWLIDHTRAFQDQPSLWEPERVTHIEHGVWERLRNLDDAVIEQHLHGLISGSQTRSLLRRREQLVSHIEGLIAERGPGAVLFRWHGPATTAPSASEALPPPAWLPPNPHPQARYRPYALASFRW